MTVALCVSICGVSFVTRCSADDPSFREFASQEVPTPDQLARLLGGLSLPASEGQGTPDTTELAAFAERILSDMSPESREQLGRWAGELLAGQSSPGGTPEDLARSSDLLRRQMEQNPALARELVDRIRTQMESRGGRVPEGLMRPGAAPGGAGGSGGTRSSVPNLDLEDLNTDSLRQLFERFRSQGSAGPPGSSPRSGVSSPPRRFPPMTSNPTNANRSNAATSGSRSQAAPPPDRAGQRPASGGTASRNPLDSSRELRDRLNRILFDAARESSEQLVRPSRENPSELSETVNAALNRLVHSARDTLNDRDPQWQRRVSRSFDSSSRRMRRSAEGSSIHRWMRSGGSVADAMAAGPRNRAMMIGLVAVLGVLVAAFVWRRQLKQHVGKYFGAVSHSLGFGFRLGVVNAPADLVRALDRFLLWQFGKSSDWWHGRRVEQSLCTGYPHLSAEIGALVANYERSRYAPRTVRISTDELRQSAETLRRLVELNDNEPRQ